MEIPYTEALGRALRALPADERIPILVSILPRVKWTTTAQNLAAYLLEASSAQPGLRLGRELGSGEFLPLAAQAVLPLRVDAGRPDWIPALVHCQPFWNETLSGEEYLTNLLPLFGLPPKRAGLIEAWQSVHARAFPEV
jgi:hypothetical protein